MYSLTQFGTATIPSGGVTGDMPTAPSVDSFIETVGGVFDAYQSDQSRQVLPYTVSCGGYVIGTAAAHVRTQLDGLRSYRGKRARLYREDPDGNTQWAWARLDKLSAPVDPAYGPKAQEFSIDFQMASGWYQGTTTTAGTLTSSPGTISLVNSGNRTVTDAVLTFTGGGAAITGATVTATVPTVSFYFNGTVADGSALVINCGEWSVTNAGADAYSNFGLGNSHYASSWLPLAPGTTSVVVSYAGGSPVYSFAFSSGWE